jgi:hypothetical protein
MANAFCLLARTAIASGDIDWLAHDFKVALLPSATTVNTATIQFLSTVAGSIIARSGNLASKTCDDAIYDAADVLFAALTGPAVHKLVIYRDSGSGDAANEVVIYIDSFTAFTPDGTDITLRWSDGTNKIGKL